MREKAKEKEIFLLRSLFELPTANIANILSPTIKDEKREFYDM